MIENLLVVLPVFVLIAAGYAMRKLNKIDDATADNLMDFAQKYGIPCLLFLATSRVDLSNSFQPGLFISFYAGNTFAFVVGGILAWKIFKRSPGNAVAVGFSGMFSNAVLLGVPIIERAYGPAALEGVFALVSIHAPYCYLVGISSMEFARAGGKPLGETIKQILKAIFSSSLTIGILLGISVNISGITLPAFIITPVEMMKSAAIPLALFSLGAILVRYKLAERTAETVMILFLKLVMHPLIAYVLAVYVLDLSQNFTRAAVMTAAMAPGINVYVFASMYDRAKGTAANAVLLGTLASIVSVSIWLQILGT
ncbi:MAG: malonate transporter [Rhodobacteraceae bacterium]|nr:MAG: malonate transporter [Paracoccaceae bacterium]